jgi:hypothetical protein
VFIAGLTAELHAPWAADLAEATRVNDVAPHCIASTFTFSPAAPLDTVPERVTVPPYLTWAAEAFIEMPVRTITVPRRRVLSASR